MAGVGPWTPRGSVVDGIVGEAVPVRFFLARSRKAAVKIQRLTAYPMGFEFQVVALSVGGAVEEITGEWPRPWLGAEGGVEVAPDDRFRLRVEFADGSSADNTARPADGRRGPTPALQNRGLILEALSGGSSAGSTNALYWVSPLPPLGSVVFQCEWPKYGLRTTRRLVDSDLIVDAAMRSIEVWTSPDEA